MSAEFPGVATVTCPECGTEVPRTREVRRDRRAERVTVIIRPIDHPCGTEERARDA